MIVKRVEIHGDAIRGADFILPPVPAPNALGIVVLDREVAAQLSVDFLGSRRQPSVAAKGQYCYGDRGQLAVEFQHYPHRVAVGFLVVGVQPESQHCPVQAAGRFHDVGVVATLRLVVEVGQVLAAGLGVLAEVVVGAVGDAFQFRPAPREAVFDVVAVLGIMGQFVGSVAPKTEVFLAYAVGHIPVEASLDPLFQPLFVRAGFDEVLHFHLFELASSESEVPGRNLVAERLAHLGDAEGKFLTGGIYDVGKVDEDTLSGLRSQIHFAGSVFHRTHEGTEHQVEAPGIGEVAPAYGAVFRVHVVGTKSAVTIGAFRHRVAEVLDMAAGGPNLGVHQDGGVQPHHVVPFQDHRTPPGLFNVALQLHSQGAVVPRGAEAAVNLAALKYESPPLGNREDFVHVRIR